MNAVYTIGHSTQALEPFLELLSLHEITAIADVRSQPYSRFNPQFNREGLKAALASYGVSYAFLGQELGARSEDEQCYEDDRVQYDLLARTSLFQRGLDRVQTGTANYRLALLCAEKEPLDCHRTILVARHLIERGLDVVHILADGRAEPHADTMRRLAHRLGMAEDNLFQSRQTVLSRAYAEQGSRIAYKRTVTEIPNGNSLENYP